LHKLQAHGPGSVGAPPDAGPAYVLKCLLSPDVRLLATTSSDKTVKLWSLDNYSFDLTMTLTGHTRWVWDCAFSVDACYLVTASSDTSARLWDLSGDMAEAIKVYSGHHKAVTCCALNDSS
jgi:G protein beta subunit-like protein